MLSKKIHVSVFLLLLLVITGLPNALQVQGQEGEYYYVGDKKIHLSVSKNFKAFSMKPGMSPSNRRGFEANIRAEGVGTVEHSTILEKYGVVLIRPQESVTPSAFRSSMESLGTHEEVEAEIPVYAIGKTSAVLVNVFLIQFQADISESRIKEFLRDNNATVVKKNNKITNRYTVTFEGKTPKEALNLSNMIHQDPKVVFSEPDFVNIIPSRPKIKSSGPSSFAPSPSSTTPNDPLFSQQWGLHNTGNPGVADADIDAPEAWGHEKGNSEVIIAIIDEGTDTQHPDLLDKIVTPFDATDGDNDQEPNPWDGHGTACAGIAAAVTNNNLGVAGVGWNVKIMPIRIASSNCRGCDWITSNSIIEDGLRTAVDRGADVLSNSWGGGSPSNAINSAIDFAISNNRVVVIAAANDAGPVSYPANLSTNRDIIAVSATNEFDEFKTKTSQDGEDWWGSNFGPEINIAAPGVHIYTTDISGADGYVNGNYIPNFNGTSSATPFVAGAAALVLSQNPSMTPAQVRDRLQDTADDLGPTGFDNQFGHGRLNLERALNPDGTPAVPNVVGQTQTDAEAAIVAEGLTVGNVTTEHHPSIAEGNVISQNPGAGTNVAAGSAVDLVISIGPNGDEDSKQIPVAPLTTGSISEAGMVNDFHFIVEKAGSYIIETQGSTDTYMSLFGPNSATTLIAENDDIEVGKNYNSRIIRNLNPGTYHVTIRHYSSSGKGDYTITVQPE